MNFTIEIIFADIPAWHRGDNFFCYGVTRNALF